MTSAQGPAAPLAGITVVALEQAVAAPMCTRVLADFGARVIKVENPPAGGTSPAITTTWSTALALAAHFVWANRNKESIALDLKSAQGLEILHRLLDRADAWCPISHRDQLRDWVFHPTSCANATRT